MIYKQEEFENQRIYETYKNCETEKCNVHLKSRLEAAEVALSIPRPQTLEPRAFTANKNSKALGEKRETSFVQS